MQPYHAPPPIIVTRERRHNLHPRLRQDMAVAVPPAMNPYQQVQHIVHAISRTVPQTQRHQVLENTLRFLSHEDTSLHDYEVDMGMDRALCLQLGYLDMLQSSASPTATNTTPDNKKVSQEVEEQILICWCLTRIYQCSRETRLRSFQEIGQTDVVPILVKILKRYTTAAAATTATTLAITHRLLSDQTQQSSAESSILLVPVLHILRMFAKLDTNAKASILQWKDGRLLTVLVDMLQPTKHTHDASSSDYGYGLYSEQPAAVFEAFGLLKDLSFRLCDSDKECMYTKLSEFLVQFTDNTIITTVVGPILKEKILESIAAMYWNFATSPKLSLEMAHGTASTTTLGHLLQYTGTGEEPVKIRRNALSAFGNVVAALTARGPILTITDTHSHGLEDTNCFVFQQQQEWIRPTLLQLLLRESDKDIQRRAMRTIRCLASCSWGRKLLVAGDSESRSSSATDLDSHITMVLKKDSVFDIPTRIQACKTIGSLTQDPDIMARIGPNLERTLTQTIECMNYKQHLEGQAGLVAAACRALFLSLERGSWRREGSIPCSNPFFANLLSCSKVDPETTHPPMAKLLLKLAEECNRIDDSQHNAGDQPRKKPDPSMLSTPVLDTISELLQPVGPPFDESRNDALQILQIFLRHDANKQVLAENEGLLTALVGFALLTVQDDKKKCAKRMILELVPEL